MNRTERHEYSRNWTAAERAKVRTVTCRCVFCGHEADVTDSYPGGWHSADLEWEPDDPTSPGWRCKDDCAVPPGWP